MIDAQTEIYGVIGNPLRHSLSPLIHNYMFKKNGFNAVYLAFEVTNLQDAIVGIRALGIRGLSVTIPFKREIISLIDHVDEVAGRIKAVNTIVNDRGNLIGFNTDWIGAIKALEDRVELEGKKILLLGAGGAARAIAFGLKEKGCEILIFNRTKERAKELAEELALSTIASLKEMNVDIIINATPVGMYPNDKETLIQETFLKEEMIVMDIVYSPLETRLLHEARARGCQAIDGLEMLIYQAVSQFEIWTKRRLDVKEFKKYLYQLFSPSLNLESYKGGLV